MNESIDQQNKSKGRMLRFSLSYRTISRFSFCLWLTSLPFTGLVLYADQRELTGFEILASGWLGLLTLNFAWLANPIFLFTLMRISARKKSVGMAAIGLLLAIDTVRFSRILLDEGGASSGVYGYGWGAVLWFIAICLALAAAGALELQRDAELNAFGAPGNASADSIPVGFVGFVGFTLSILVLTFTGFFFFKDHSRANKAELLRLKGLAFKRGEVCAVPEPKPQSQVDIANGVIEVKIANGELNSYPFNGPNQFLEWGIPKVRFDNRDYYVGQLDGKKSTVSDPASVTPVAQLFITSDYLDGRSQITAKLVADGGKKIIFNQTWLAETKANDRFCPEFSSFPSADIQPRKLLMDALRNVKKAPSELPSATPRKADDIKRIPANIVKIKEYADRPIPNARGGWHDPRPAGSLGWKQNRNCPKDVGWGGASVIQNSARLDTGWPFLIGEKSFYLGNRDEYNALCQGDFVYLSTISVQNGKNLIHIEKRSLGDFQTAWKATAVIDKQITPNPIHLKLTRVSETAGEVTLDVVNEHDWTVVEMTMPAVTGINRPLKKCSSNDPGP